MAVGLGQIGGAGVGEQGQHRVMDDRQAIAGFQWLVWPASSLEVAEGR
jgi:hypothetical protein